MHPTLCKAVAPLCAAAFAATLSLPAAAAEADDRTADQLFGYSYGEGAPVQPAAAGTSAQAKPGSDALELEFRGQDDARFLDHEPRRGNTLEQYGIAGTGTGASILALGGLVFLGSRFAHKDTTERKVLSYGGLTLVGLGGALFISGAVCLGVSLARKPKHVAVPAPTADGRGAQILYSFDF